jgi:hypothetical protein
MSGLLIVENTNWRLRTRAIANQVECFPLYLNNKNRIGMIKPDL